VWRKPIIWAQQIANSTPASGPEPAESSPTSGAVAVTRREKPASWPARGSSSSLGFLVKGTLTGAFLTLVWGGLVRVFVPHHATFIISSLPVPRPPPLPDPRPGRRELALAGLFISALERVELAGLVVRSPERQRQRRRPEWVMAVGGSPWPVQPQAFAGNSDDVLAGPLS
jgi:hypothetical protein